MQRSTPRSFQVSVGSLQIQLRPKGILAVVLALLSLVFIALLPDDLSATGKIALGTFALTVIAWTLTDINDTFVALLAAAGLVLSSTISTENFFASLGNSVIWLMIGAFIVAAALNQSGVSARITAIASRAARNVGMLFYLLTAALLLTALFIPSTSARAALMVPIYQAMANAFRDAKINRALALMLPVNILQSAVASLIGAGAHLVINDALGQLSGRQLSFFEWILMGVPFAAISAFGSTWVILRLFLDKRRRKMPLNAATLAGMPQPGPISRQERYIIGVTIALVILWATESFHGIDNALIALMGALAVSVPVLGAFKFRDASRFVEWEMIIFVAATLALSEALVETGAGRWLVDALLVQSGLANLGATVAVIAGVTLVTLTSHLYISSRSARGAVIAPLTVLLSYSFGLDPVTMAFVTAAGIGYCITLVVSAKPLTMFQQLGGDGKPAFAASDLMRLSGVLAPPHIALIVLFGAFYWPLFGKGHPTTATEAESRRQIAPITTGNPGLIDDGLFVPDEVLDDAGVQNIGGELQVPTEQSCNCAPTPSPTRTPTAPLTLTATVTPQATTTARPTNTATSVPPTATATPVPTVVLVVPTQAPTSPPPAPAPPPPAPPPPAPPPPAPPPPAPAPPPPSDDGGGGGDDDDGGGDDGGND